MVLKLPLGMPPVRVQLIDTSSCLNHELIEFQYNNITSLYAAHYVAISMKFFSSE